MLSQQQLSTLKTAVLANTDTIPAGHPWSGIYAGTQVKDVPNNPDGNVAVAGYYNLTASPDFWVFPSTVQVEQVVLAVNGAEYLALGANAAATNLHHNLFALLTRNGVIRPGDQAVRTLVTTIFPVGTAPLTRAAILEACTRKATRAEQLFAITATGPGGGAGSSRAAAANLGFEGHLTGSDVNSALNLE